MTNRIVQSLWIGETLGSMQQLGIQSFLRNDHEFHLFTYDPITNVPPGTTMRDARDVLPRDSVFAYQHGFGKGSYSAFSNLFRYQMLLKSGGWWVDTDVVCLKPLDMESEYAFAAEHDDDFTVKATTCAIKSPAGAPFLEYCVSVCHAANKEQVKWGELGPILFHDGVTRFDLDAHMLPVAAFNPINWFECGDMVKPAFDMHRVADSYAVHLYHQMWKHEDREPGSAAPDSLYAHLQSRYLSADLPRRQR